MSLTQELTRLEQLYERGALSADEYTRAKARLIAAPPSAGGVPPVINQLRRSTTDRWLGGLCGGLAVATGVDAWVWRLLFALAMLAGGSGVMVYLLLWIFVPMQENAGATPE